MSTVQNFAKSCAVRHCGQLSITAAGTGDNTEQTGPTVDRLITTTGAVYNSARLDILYTTTLGSSETLKLTAKIQDSADNSTWNTAVVLQAATTVETGVQTGKKGVASYQVDFAGRARYVRILWTADLSASGTDTAILSAQLTMGGASILPCADTFQV